MAGYTSTFVTEVCEASWALYSDEKTGHRTRELMIGASLEIGEGSALLGIVTRTENALENLS